MSLLNFFKNHYLVTISEANRNKNYSEYKFLVRAWTAWKAFDIAKSEAASKPKGKNGGWVVYDMKKL